MTDLKKKDPIKFKVEVIKQHGLDKLVAVGGGKPQLLSSLIAIGQQPSAQELGKAGYSVWDVRNINAFLESGEALGMRNSIPSAL